MLSASPPWPSGLTMRRHLVDAIHGEACYRAVRSTSLQGRSNLRYTSRGRVHMWEMFKDAAVIDITEVLASCGSFKTHPAALRRLDVRCASYCSTSNV